MRFLTPVVWHEGMHLAQHHFQAQGRYFEDLSAFVLSSLLFRPYGVAGCEFDEEALRNDTLALRHARGVMPDGLAFQFPDEPAPEPRPIRDLFSPTQDSHRVLLALPPLRAGRPNCADDAGLAPAEPTRFRPVSREVADDVSGTEARPVDFAARNFRLLLDAEDVAGLVTLPLARVRRDGSGHFRLDPEYIPPSLHVGASERLVSLLARLVETLGARGEALAGKAEAPGELASFWLANTLNVALGPLAHLLRTRHAHPEQLYTELLRLAGALCTFSMEAHPRDLPMYDHDRLGECFGALDARIHALLGVVAPTSSVRIPLRPQAESFYAGEVADSRCFGSAAHWYLGVRAGESPAELSARVPRLVKVCSGKFIERLVREAFPGLPLQHTLAPPSQISPRQGTEYFAIPKTGPCWASIVETREVGIYAPASIPGAQLELVIALESGG